MPKSSIARPSKIYPNFYFWFAMYHLASLLTPAYLVGNKTHSLVTEVHFYETFLSPQTFISIKIAVM
jgi:hypothetical protein